MAQPAQLTIPQARPEASASVASAVANAPGRIEALDYLRGLLALSVMLYHYLGWSDVKLGYPLDQVFQRLGVYAVCTFYALSGTSLGIVYARRKVNGAFLTEFAIKRFFRIAPLFWTATTLTIVLRWILMPRLGLAEAVVHPVLLAGASYSLLFGWVRPDAYVPVGGWSIGAEMVFYSFFPGLLVLMRPSRWRPVLVFGATLAVGLIFSSFLLSPKFELGSGEQWPFYINAMNHLFLFAGGVMLALLHDKIKKPAAHWIVSICLASVCIFAFLPLPTGGAVLVTGWERVLFGGLSLAFCYVALSWPFQFGRFAHVFVWIGNISYAVYLLHPIAGDVTEILNARFLHTNPLLVSCLLGIPLTLTLATLSWKYLEKPLMRCGRDVAKKLIPQPQKP